MSIPFTQYLMPDGRQVTERIDRSADVEAQAQAVIDAGYSFAVEMLSDYCTVSLTVEDRVRGDDLEIELVQNGPGVPSAVDRLVARAFANLPTYAATQEKSA